MMKEMRIALQCNNRRTRHPATGVRNSFDGVWVDDIGYLFSDNGQDAEGDDFPDEEINLLIEGGDYGWLDSL